MSAVLPFLGDISKLLTVITSEKVKQTLVSGQTYPAPAEQDARLTVVSCTQGNTCLVEEFSPMIRRTLAHPLLMLYL